MINENENEKMYYIITKNKITNKKDTMKIDPNSIPIVSALDKFVDKYKELAGYNQDKVLEIVAEQPILQELFLLLDTEVKKEYITNFSETPIHDFCKIIDFITPIITPRYLIQNPVKINRNKRIEIKENYEIKLVCVEI